MGHIKNMYDIRLKPRLLRSLVKDYLPEEFRHPIPSPHELSYLVETLKTFRLLSEAFPEECSSDVVENWTAAVDEWIERLLILVTCEMPDKCWVGVSLLGLTCQECSSSRFLSSYSFWLDDLIPLLDPSSEAQTLKVVCCISISDLFTRLGGYSNAKKDGTSYAAKLVQPVLKLLNEDTSEAVLEAAATLLCTILTFFPSSVDCDYEITETSVVSQIMSWRSNLNVLRRCAQCLSLLPKSRGDEESWLLMIQKILASINYNLNDAFLGLEEGTDIPTPLGEQEMSREAFYLARRRSKQLLHIIPTLMLSCCMMLVNPYPAQVSVPINSLLALVERVLKVDGSLSQSPLPSTAAMQQEFICSELPALHLASLDLLEAIIRGVRSQLLPHAAEIIGLLKEYFKRCVLPGLRVKIYMIVRIFLLTQGIGVALHIGEEVISNAFIDLDVIGCGSGAESSSAHSKITTEALPQLSCKKRKRVDVTRNLEEHPEGVGLEVQVPENNSTSPTPLKIAALEALETLLTVGGAMRSNCLQSNIELLLINVATNAFDGELDNEEDKVFAAMFQCNSVDLQIAALRALLACLLLPVHLWPCHLAKGLELFRKVRDLDESDNPNNNRVIQTSETPLKVNNEGQILIIKLGNEGREWSLLDSQVYEPKAMMSCRRREMEEIQGKRERETRLAEFCAHALLALENRGQTGFFSISEIACAEPSSHGEGFNHNFSENVHTSGQEGNILPLSTPQSSDIPDSGDNPCDNWLGNDDIIEVPPTHPDENTGNAGEFSETNIQQAAEDLLAENIPRDGLLGEIPGDSNQEQALTIEMESGKSKDVIVLEPDQYPNPISIKGVKEVSQDTDRGLETIPVEAEAGMTRPDNEASLHYIPEVEEENPDSC